MIVPWAVSEGSAQVVTRPHTSPCFGQYVLVRFDPRLPSLALLIPTEAVGTQEPLKLAAAPVAGTATGTAAATGTATVNAAAATVATAAAAAAATVEARATATATVAAAAADALAVAVPVAVAVAVSIVACPAYGLKSLPEPALLLLVK